MSSQDPQPVRTALSGNVLRITLPPRVANDAKAFAKVVANLGDITGCRPCNSGMVCIFDFHRDWVVNEDMKFQPGAARQMHG